MKKVLFVLSMFSVLFVITGCDDDGGNNENNNNQLCGTEVCGDNAHCDATSVACVCDDGYTGDPLAGCTQDMCYNVTCGTNAHCNAEDGSCVCDDGYTGDPQTECTSAICEGVTCGTNAHCNDEDGSCVCDDGYTGDPQTECTAVTTCDDNTCNGHGTCDDSSGVAECTCDPGYEGYFCDSCQYGYVEEPAGSGNCVDDPCEPDPCYDHGTCTSNGGVPECACDDGYAGGNCNRCDDGYMEDPAHPGICIVDPCASFDCGHGTCSLDASLLPTCDCETGYTDTHCDTCAGGFVEFPSGSGLCAANTCDPSPCSHGTCSMDATGMAVCSCETGYTGALCDTCDTGYVEFPSGSGTCIVDPCLTTDCGHGSCSLDGSGQAMCTCETGYAGSDCSTCAGGYVEIPAGSGTCIDNACDPDPCSGHGSCSLDASGLAVCACETGYTGSDCSSCDTGYVEFPSGSGTCVDDACDPDPCSIHGTCSMDAGGQAVCTCETGYAGSDCSGCDTGYVEIPAGSGTCIDDACDPDPCGSHGSCSLDAGGQAECTCTDGYSGDNCEISPHPTTGSLAVTEIMFDPNQVADASGWYFEVVNDTDTPVDLADVTFTVNGTALILPSAEWLLNPHEYIVIGVNDATSSNGGIYVDVLFDTMVLDATGTIEISYDATVVDTVSWDSSWNTVSGRALKLSPAALGGAAIFNDSKYHWCFAQNQIPGSSDYGTPGMENSNCEIDWCNIQWPSSTTTEDGTSTENIYGRVYVEKLTDVSDETPFITAQVGYGTTDSTPDDTWNWFDASYNPGYSGSINNEEFMAKMTPTSDGTFDYVYRMSLDGGLSWTTCLDDSHNRGELTVTPPSVPVIFFSEYVEGSSTNKALELYMKQGTMDLSNCEIRIYANGATSPSSTITLNSVTLNSGELYVVCHSTIVDSTNCDLLSGDMSFNGNDVVELICDGTVYDTIGKIGENVYWSSNGVSTKDQTLRRKCSVESGDTDGYDDFDPSVEWGSYSEDTFDDLGTYTCAP